MSADNPHCSLSQAELSIFRTALCTAHQAGSCREADRCPFSHCLTWQRRNPFEVSYSPKLCPDIQFVKKGNKMSLVRRCNRGRHCQFAHSKEEELYHPLTYKTKMCSITPVCTRFFCPFAHQPDELRTPRSPSAAKSISSPLARTSLESTSGTALSPSSVSEKMRAPYCVRFGACSSFSRSEVSTVTHCCSSDSPSSSSFPSSPALISSNAALDSTSMTLMQVACALMSSGPSQPCADELHECVAPFILPNSVHYPYDLRLPDEPQDNECQGPPALMTKGGDALILNLAMALADCFSEDGAPGSCDVWRGTSSDLSVASNLKNRRCNPGRFGVGSSSTECLDSSHHFSTEIDIEEYEGLWREIADQCGGESAVYQA